MSFVCPQCSQVNQEGTTFCRKCGYQFQGNEQSVSEEATIRPPSLANLPPNADPGDTLKQGNTPAVVAQPTPIVLTPQPQPQAGAPNIGAPVYQQPVAAPNPGQQQPPFFAQPVPQGNYAQPVYGQPHYGTPMPAPAPGAGLGILERAFAGKGTPVHHQSWLLENKQAQPQNLRNSFIEYIHTMGVLGVTSTPERLHEQGLAMEERDYVKVQYGTSSVFVYMAPMGQNLYVSRTSTIQQPYSRIRMVVLAVLAVLMLISLILYAVINPTIDPLTNNPGAYGLVSAFKTFFFYAFYGLLFFFIIAALRSLVFWLTDKDLLAILRPNRVNDFTLDALSSIELTTDKALRETLQKAGLNAEEIKPPAQSYPLQQALHRI